jgi:hypothetical protein
MSISKPARNPASSRTSADSDTRTAASFHGPSSTTAADHVTPAALSAASSHDQLPPSRSYWNSSTRVRSPSAYPNCTASGIGPSENTANRRRSAGVSSISRAILLHSHAADFSNPSCAT